MTRATLPATLGGLEPFANLIDGEARPSTAGRFEVRAVLDPFEELGSWPVSGPADVLEALERPSATGWSTLPEAERRACLGRAAGRLPRDDALRGLLARRPGLAPDEADSGLRPRGERERSGAAGVSVEEPGVALVAPHWSADAGELFDEVASRLLHGHRVVLLPDPRLPFTADRVAAALGAEGLPPAALAVVHGATDEALAAACAARAVRVVSAVGPVARIALLRRALESRGGVRQELERVRTRTVEVGPDEDVDARAVTVVDQAFGRRRALSGWRPGQVGRVFCAERSFSRFSEALLRVLGESPDVRTPLPPLDRAANDELRRAWALGLDEGATLVFGGEDLDSGGRVRARPAVFTNVEPRMLTARRVEPAPVLCLIRVRGKGPPGRAGEAPERRSGAPGP